jgi:hypothetical protein
MPFFITDFLDLDILLRILPTREAAVKVLQPAAVSPSRTVRRLECLLACRKHENTDNFSSFSLSALV